MITLVIGGAASGKSAYAESLVQKMPPPRYYVATLDARDEESVERVKRHRAHRQGLAMETVEWPCDERAIERMGDACVLVDGLGNLVASAMYERNGSLEHDIDLLLCLLDTVRDCVVVSDDVYRSSESADIETTRYLECLSSLEQLVRARSHRVVEVVCGIPVTLLDEGRQP